MQTTVISIAITWLFLCIWDLQPKLMARVTDLYVLTTFLRREISERLSRGVTQNVAGYRMAVNAIVIPAQAQVTAGRRHHGWPVLRFQPQVVGSQKLGRPLNQLHSVQLCINYGHYRGN